MHQFVSGEVDVLVSTLIVETRARRAEREHDVREPRRPLRPRAALPAARPRRPLAPPRLLLPARARRGGRGRGAPPRRCSSTTPSSAPGYRIALKDMELRGAGNLLGPEQSRLRARRRLRHVPAACSTRPCSASMQGDGAPKLVPADVSLDVPAYLPDDYVVVAGGEARRLPAPHARSTTAGRDRGAARRGPRPVRPAARRRPRHSSRTALLRVVGGVLGVEGILVRGDEARITFRDSAVPRMKGLVGGVPRSAVPGRGAARASALAQADPARRRADARRARSRIAFSCLTCPLTSPSHRPCVFVQSLPSSRVVSPSPPARASRTPSPPTPTSPPRPRTRALGHAPRQSARQRPDRRRALEGERDDRRRAVGRLPAARHGGRAQRLSRRRRRCGAQADLRQHARLDDDRYAPREVPDLDEQPGSRVQRRRRRHHLGPAHPVRIPADGQRASHRRRPRRTRPAPSPCASWPR